jgi:hypothetical protein
MREHEMRMRVFRFLKARMRNMIMPATVGLGIGLAAGGCKTEGLVTQDARGQADLPAKVGDSAIIGDATAAKSDVLGSDSSTLGPDLAAVDTRDALVTNDVAPDLGRDVSTTADRPSEAVAGDAAKADVAALDTAKVDVVAAVDGNDDMGTIVVKYGTPVPDAADDTGGIAPVYIAPVYSAITPDASPARDGLVVRYMAQIPDAGADAVLATLYMAPVQS